MIRLALAIAACVLVLAGCAHSQPPASHEPSAPQAQAQSDEDAALSAVRAVHGGAGPWAVAGYRMGRHALAQLGLPPGSRDLEVTHFSPSEVQYTCTADGAAAATGASLGKLNLALREAPVGEVHTVFHNRKSGATVTLRPSSKFVARFLNVPMERLGAAGREVLRLPDDEVFEVVPP